LHTLYIGGCFGHNIANFYVNVSQRFIGSIFSLVFRFPAVFFDLRQFISGQDVVHPGSNSARFYMDCSKNKQVENQLFHSGLTIPVCVTCALESDGVCTNSSLTLSPIAARLCFCCFLTLPLTRPGNSRQ
jgi:hypothetical protein